MHLVNGTGSSPSGTANPGLVKHDNSSRGSIDTTKTCARVRGQWAPPKASKPTPWPLAKPALPPPHHVLGGGGAPSATCNRQLEGERLGSSYFVSQRICCQIWTQCGSFASCLCNPVLLPLPHTFMPFLFLGLKHGFSEWNKVITGQQGE